MLRGSAFGSGSGGGTSEVIVTIAPVDDDVVVWPTVDGKPATTLVLNPATDLTLLTVGMPADPIDGQIARICCVGFGVASLVLSPEPSTPTDVMEVGDYSSWQWDESLTDWVRLTSVQGTQGPQGPQGDPGTSQAGIGATIWLASTTNHPLSASATVPIIFDTDGQVDAGFTTTPASGQIEVTDAGWYALYAHLRLSANVNANFLISILDSGGATVAKGSQASGSQIDICSSSIAYLPAASVLTANIYAGATSNYVGNAASQAFTCFSVVKL